MEKTFRNLNIILFIATCAMTVYYDYEGGLWLKGLTGFCFVLLGIVNLVYAIATKQKKLSYAIWMTLGLAVCLTGDIVLNIEFLPGVAIFAVGHVLYIIAFCQLHKIRATDLIAVGLLFMLALAIIKLVPFLDFGSSLVENLCIVYGLVISCMVGKAISNFIHCRTRTNALLLAGSILFYFSDVMLVLCRFGDGGQLADTLCLFSYFPAQSLLACSVYSKIQE